MFFISFLSEGLSVLQRASEVASYLLDSKDVHIVTHIDADGITAGAIASEMSAKKFAINVIEKNITDLGENTTRFVSVSKKANAPDRT